MVKITGLGGFCEVGRSAIFLETGKEKFLFDFGLDVQTGAVPFKHRDPNWIKKLDDFLILNEKEILKSAGTVSHLAMEKKVRKELEKYNKK